MKNLFFTLLLLWASLPVFAQNEKPIFWVLYGQYPIGTTFNQQDWIISKDDIVPIVLIAQIEGFVILREKGKWQAQDLWNKLVSEKKIDAFPELYVGEKNPKRDDLLKFGVIERCLPPPIATCLPIYNKEVLSNQLTIQWRKQPNQEPYRVIIKNTFDEIISEKTTKDTLMNVDFTYVIKDSSYFMIVEISQCDTIHKNSSSCRCPLMYSFELMEAQKKGIKELAYQKFLQTTQKLSPALANLHEGLWFYKNASLIEAFTFFQKAHTLLPNSKALYFVLGQILAENSYHYHATEVYPRWRLVL